MSFLGHLDKEFAYSKESFLYALNKLPESKTIVINIGINSLSYNTGFLNIRIFKNFIKDISELVNSSLKRHVVIVISDSLEQAERQYLQAQDSPSANSRLYSALVALAHSDIVNLFYDGFADYNLRAIGFSVSSASADVTGELSKTLRKVEGVVFSETKDDATKLHAVRELVNSRKRMAQSSNLSATARRTAETIKGLYRNFPGTVPIIMEDVSQKDNEQEEDEGFAAKIAISLNADVVVSISSRGMLYTVDPSKNKNALPFYCFDTSRKEPFNEDRRAALAKKLNAARHVNAYNRPIPLVLTPYNSPYAICDIFDRNIIRNICQNGDYPSFTLFVNSRNASLPIEARPISGAIVIDANAEKTLLQSTGSLLPVGIIEVRGTFESKAVVAILNEASEVIGRGVVTHGSAVIKEKLETPGTGKSDEIINRTKMRFN